MVDYGKRSQKISCLDILKNLREQSDSTKRWWVQRTILMGDNTGGARWK